MDKMRGVIKWFNGTRGYGFISQDQGEDIFVHISSISDERFHSLEEGQQVEFKIDKGPKGLQALDVHVVANDKQEQIDELLDENEYIGIINIEGKNRVVSVNKDGQYRFIDGTEKIHNILFLITRENAILRETVEELESIINDPESTEQTFQRFFERNPRLILNDEYKNAHPHIMLSTQDGTLIPDFLLEPINEKKLCDVLDIKKPNAKIFVLKKSRMRYSAAVMEACAQLREYSDYFDDEKNRDKVFKEYGLLAYKPKMIVIIGRRGDIDPIISKKIESDKPHLIVKTYDDVLQLAKSKLEYYR